MPGGDNGGGPDRLAGDAPQSVAAMCSRGGPEPVLRMPSVPVHIGALWTTREAALSCPRGEMVLCFCPQSGLLINGRFDARLAEYSVPSDKALGASPVFRAYEAALADWLAGRLEWRGGVVVEIAPADTTLLDLIGRSTGAAGVGLEPWHAPDRAAASPSSIEIRSGDLDDDDLGGEGIDLVVMRHVLEHLGDPLAALRAVRRGPARREGTRLYVEVPNGLLAVRRLSIWDLIYEHATYFVTASLERMLAEAGFEVIALGESYDEQFVWADARAVTDRWAPPERTDELDALRADIAELPMRYRDRLAEWRRRVERVVSDGPRPVVWGAGAKTVSFFNLLGIGEEIETVVDLSTKKQGHYLPGTGQRIVAPEALRDSGASAVLVMNPIYLDEIAEHVSALGLDVPVLPVTG